MDNSLPSGAVKRLSGYRRILYKLKALGFIKIFSDNLADALGVSAAQVRKDFAYFKLSGNKKGGYDIDRLLDKINKILGKKTIQKVIIVGCGRMGTALMNYNGFSGEGIKVVAGFDSAPKLIDVNAKIPIYDINDLPDFLKHDNIKVAILTVPESAAPQIHEMLVSCGIKGILNFTPLQIKSTPECIVHNINIALELENMFFFVNSLCPKSATNLKSDLIRTETLV